MLTIRTAQREDAPLLSEMGNTSYRHHFAHLWHSASELAHFLQQEYSCPPFTTASAMSAAAG